MDLNRQYLKYEVSEDALNTPPEEKQEVHFPVIMFGFAVVKEFILDPIMLLLTLILPPVGWLLGFVINIIFGAIMFVWMFFRTKLDQRIMLKFTAKLLLTIMVGAIPGFRFIIPEFTILILLIYFEEKGVFDVPMLTVHNIL